MLLRNYHTANQDYRVDKIELDHLIPAYRRLREELYEQLALRVVHDDIGLPVLTGPHIQHGLNIRLAISSDMFATHAPARQPTTRPLGHYPDVEIISSS